MTAPWMLPDFDNHEGVHIVSDGPSGLTAVIAIHSTHRGPAAGGARYWHYADPEAAITDALRLSRGMSYKNAMADLPLGGGKAVLLAPARGAEKSAEYLAAFGRGVEALGGRYVTAEDVGMSVDNMIAIGRATRHVSGLPVAEGSAGGDPGPFTAHGVYLGVLAAIKRGLGKDGASGVHVAVQGVGSVGGGVARKLAADGAKLTLADVDQARAAKLAGELGAEVADPQAILAMPCDVLSPNALGAILDEQSIAALQTSVVAGGANNQLATPADGQRLLDRGVLYAPDYVINAGGIINVGLEYLGQGGRDEVMARIAKIPVRLEQIWAESETQRRPASDVADTMAQALIGR